MSRENQAFVITGPTSGYGHATALELAKHGAVVLVSRGLAKLEAVKAEIERGGGAAVVVQCDLSNLASVRDAAAKIGALGLPIAGVVNNAGIREATPTKAANGWDMSFATNHAGPFVFTEALLPHLADGTNVVFIVSAVEDPERKPAAAAGFRGGRYVSAEASARGEWKPGGSTRAGFDSYATTKQASLAIALALARENPRLRINAVEPGVAPATGLGGLNPVVRFIVGGIAALLAGRVKFITTPARAAKVIAKAALNPGGVTGVYFDEKGDPMKGSTQVSDPAFQDRVVAETRAVVAGA